MMKTVRKDDLVRGDHIYTDRILGLYFHHGIYVGDDMVIHPMGPSKIYNRPPCKKCGFKPQTGIFKSCIDCFLQGHSLNRCKYEVSSLKQIFNSSGTCITVGCKPADEVVQIAHRLLEDKSFGSDNYFMNNCKDFAVYCKTGAARSNQAASLLGKAGYTVYKEIYMAAQ